MANRRIGHVLNSRIARAVMVGEVPRSVRQKSDPPDWISEAPASLRARA
jgi:hypothetical protein